MKEIILSQSKVALVDDADYEWLSQWKWSAHRYTGCNTFYADRKDYRFGWGKNAKEIKMHRLILGLTDPKVFADHIDGDGLNNQRYNLRVATRSQNGANRKSWGTSKYLGVSKKGNRWVAQIKSDGKRRWIGSFVNEQDAALAYNEAAVRLHVEFARPNKIAI